MKLSNMERETILLFNEAEPTASVYTFNPALQKQLAALCRTHPNQVSMTYKGSQGAIDFQIPKKWIRIVPPRILTPAQREVIEKMNEQKRQKKFQLTEEQRE